ncbi:MAG TPA: hypothetical protein VF062_07505 [Candidatus Limnocylindrales bacterium]
MRPLLIVDAANVMGSVPDGWWRDRPAAAERLRDSLVPQAKDYDVRLVVEGKARGISSIPGVPVHAASGSGDDAIVELVAAEPGRRRVVVTADRALRERVKALGAEVIGPRAIRG